jgi:hypothetical protein
MLPKAAAALLFFVFFKKNFQFEVLVRETTTLSKLRQEQHHLFDHGIDEGGGKRGEYGRRRKFERGCGRV